MSLKMVPYSGTRTVTLIVALATLTSNILSAVFFYQLPDDPYHLAGNFGWYLHVANLLSVFGFVGALRQHAPSVAIFANYLLLDTLLSTIPRFFILLTITSFSSSICAPFSALNPSSLPSSSNFILYALTPHHAPHSEYLTQSEFTTESCTQTVFLGQLMLGAGVVAATVLQFAGALCVKGYARVLWVREVRDEECAAEAERMAEEMRREERRAEEEEEDDEMGKV